MVVIRLLVAILVLFALFFLPAGTLAYWEAWMSHLSDSFSLKVSLDQFSEIMYISINGPGVVVRIFLRFQREKSLGSEGNFREI